jgi:hypothetical protein
VELVEVVRDQAMCRYQSLPYCCCHYWQYYCWYRSTTEQVLMLYVLLLVVMMPMAHFVRVRPMVTVLVGQVVVVGWGVLLKSFHCYCCSLIVQLRLVLMSRHHVHIHDLLLHHLHLHQQQY